MSANKEYTALVNDIYSANTTDLYQILMGREARVLDTIDRVATQVRDKEQDSKQFLHSSLLEMWRRGASSLSGILMDLTEAKSYGDVLKSIRRNNRSMYIGVLLVISAFFILVIRI